MHVHIDETVTVADGAPFFLGEDLGAKIDGCREEAGLRHERS
jgi:hypothetical protein